MGRSKISMPREVRPLPHLHTVFTITVVDLPAAYGVFIGRDFLKLGGYIMNNGSCMMLPTKDGGFTKIIHPSRVKKVCLFREERHS